MSQDSRAIGRGGVRVARVFGVPVIISPTWLILAVLVTVLYSGVVQSVRPDWSDGLAYLVGFGFVVTLCGSVFLHELGHALMCRRHGIGVRSITLEMLGGYTEMTVESPRPKVEAAVAMAGPAVSAVLGLIGVAALVFTSPATLAGQFAFQIAVCNILVAIYNALPGLPLDGGRALRALVWARTGDKHLASRVAGWCGRVVAVLTAGGGAWLYLVGFVSVLGVVIATVVGASLWIGATQSLRAAVLGARVQQLDVAQLTKPAAQVRADVPLAEVWRQADLHAAAGVIVVDDNGAPTALLHETAAAAVPEHRRRQVSVGDVSRALHPGQIWDPSWRGEQVVVAMRRFPADEYAVAADGNVLGIVRGADIAAALQPRRTALRHAGSDRQAARRTQARPASTGEPHEDSL